MTFQPLTLIKLVGIPKDLKLHSLDTNSCKYMSAIHTYFKLACALATQLLVDASGNKICTSKTDSKRQL